MLLFRRVLEALEIVRARTARCGSRESTAALLALTPIRANKCKAVAAEAKNGAPRLPKTAKANTRARRAPRAQLAPPGGSLDAEKNSSAGAP